MHFILVVVSLALLVPAYIWIKRLIKWFSLRHKVNKFVGPPSYPFIGSLGRFLFQSNSERTQTFLEMCKEYSPIFRMWRSAVPIIVLTHPDFLEKILGSSINIEKGRAYEFTHEWLGTGLLTSKGAKWHSRRKLITPAFHFKILEGFMEVFVLKSNQLVKVLQKEGNNKAFDICPYISKCTLDIILETAMGISIKEEDNEDQVQYLKAIRQITELIIYRLLSPIGDKNFIFSLTENGRKFKETIKILHKFTKKVIQQRKKQENKSLKDDKDKTENIYLGKRRLAFLDILLEAQKEGNKLTDEDIREEVDTFMFEGHDTTTVSIYWTLYLLGLHQDIQEKVYAELKDILNDEDMPITAENLIEMKYLEQVIKESLRLYPSVPFISRTLTEDVNINGYVLPAGVVTTLFIFMVHRAEEYFPNPEEFNPDNFLPENISKRPPYAYIPFSGGPRNCIGQKFALMEEKTVLATILRKYRFESIEDRSKIKLVNDAVLRSENGILVKLFDRCG